jgi:transposase-like protein
MQIQLHTSDLPKPGEEYKCPRCRHRDKTIAILKPIRGTPSEDRFKCERCKREFYYSDKY